MSTVCSIIEVGQPPNDRLHNSRTLAKSEHAKMLPYLSDKVKLFVLATIESSSLYIFFFFFFFFNFTTTSLT